MSKVNYIKDKAIEQRKRGWTLTKICSNLHLSKTTVYYWIKDLPKPPREVTKLQYKNLMLGSQKMARICREKREEAYRRGQQQAESLLKKRPIRDFVILFMTEGTQKTRHSVTITNSDPSIIKFSYDILHYLTDKNPKVRIYIYPDHDENIIRSFWKKLLVIKNNQEIKIHKKGGSGLLGGRNNTLNFGIAHVTIHDTYLRSRIQAWVDIIKQEFSGHGVMANILALGASESQFESECPDQLPE